MVIGSHVQEELHGAATVFTIVQGPLIYIHADEAIGILTFEAASIPHRVRQGILAVVQPVLYALAKQSGDLPDALGTEIPSYGIASQG